MVEQANECSIKMICAMDRLSGRPPKFEICLAKVNSIAEYKKGINCLKTIPFNTIQQKRILEPTLPENNVLLWKHSY